MTTQRKSTKGVSASKRTVNVVRPKVKAGELETIECKTRDFVLPLLRLPFPCRIKIVIDEECVRLYVGPRDWQWDKRGKLIGKGTMLCGTKKKWDRQCGSALQGSQTKEEK